MKTYFVGLSPDEVIEALTQAMSGYCDISVDGHGHKMSLQFKMPLCGVSVLGYVRTTAGPAKTPERVLLEVNPTPAGSLVTILKDKRGISNFYIWLGIMLVIGIIFLFFTLKGTMTWNSESNQKWAATVIGSLIIVIALDKDKISQRTKLIQHIETTLAKQKGFNGLDDQDERIV